MDEGKIIYRGPACPVCQKHHEILVFKEDLNKYCYDGLSSEVCFPYLSEEEKQIVDSGLSNACKECILNENLYI